MIKHENRIPGEGKAGRVLITPESGTPYYATMEMADDATVEGTEWGKAVMDEFLAASGTTAGTATALTLAQPGFSLVDGALVRFKNHVYLSGVTGVTSTLNVENTGAIQLRHPANSTIWTIPANTWISAIYSASRNLYLIDTPSGVIYTAVGVSAGGSGTLTATLTNAPGWQQIDGALIAITFTSAVSANAILSVASQSAGNMRVGGANITAGVIPAGATATLVRSGTYWLVLAVDVPAAKPFIAMTYSGNGAAARMITVTDEKGATFTPSAVLIFQEGLRTNDNNSPYGGLAVSGRAANMGGKPYITIQANGFYVSTDVSPYTANINTSGVYYHVLAFK